MTRQEEIKALLNEHFPQLALGELGDEIAEVGRLMSFPAGAVIMDYGDYIQYVPLVIKGSVKVIREGMDGSELLLYFLNAGDTCSMSFSCCMVQKESIIRTVVEDDATFIAIPIKYVDSWVSQYPLWKNFVMSSYDNRMFEMVMTIDSIAFKKMDERLMEYLQKKAEANGNDVIQTTHQEIAYDLNASREAISRLLKKLENMGQIKLGRNQIWVKEKIN